ncbi:MAG: hypothetical protein LQ346_006177 [Caloplaca aetnensis]|nr:MAG: hypothetical protein LQ346_006177 [Caloplaca aetnensis]
MAASSAGIGSVQIRPPQRFPQHAELIDTLSYRKQYVTIKHPAYGEDENTLLTLYCPDGRAGGLHFGTARIACGIITNNQFHGSFHSGLDKRPIQLRDDDILAPGVYYYHLSQPTTPSLPPTPDATDVLAQSFQPYRYPVVPSFQHWSFPARGTLPPSWEALRQSDALAQLDFTLGSENASTTVIARDVTCRLSTYDLGCEKAHMLPKHEVAWFTNNGLKMLPDDAEISVFDTISTTANLMLLRADLHKVFDDRKFVIVPKQGRLVSHFLVPAEKYVYMHQNSEIQPTGVAIDFFFARLAWAIFPMLGKRFLKFGGKKLLVVLGKASPSFEATIADCAHFLVKPTKSGANSPEKPGSPSKRARSDGDNDDQEAELDTESSRDADKAIGSRVGEHWSAKRRRNNENITSPLPSAAPGIYDEPGAWPAKLPTTLPNWLQPTPEQAKLATMKATALQEERARSDRDGFWEDELAWYADHRFGPFSDSREVLRAELLEGKDVRDSDDEIWRAPLDFRD